MLLNKIFVLPVDSVLRRAMPWLGWSGTSAAGDEIPHGNMTKLLLNPSTWEILGFRTGFYPP
eukprot:6569174-Prymnesium_polylepis.1